MRDISEPSEHSEYKNKFNLIFTLVVHSVCVGFNLKFVQNVKLILLVLLVHENIVAFGKSKYKTISYSLYIFL